MSLVTPVLLLLWRGKTSAVNRSWEKLLLQSHFYIVIPNMSFIVNVKHEVSLQCNFILQLIIQSLYINLFEFIVWPIQDIRVHAHHTLHEPMMQWWKKYSDFLLR